MKCRATIEAAFVASVLVLVPQIAAGQGLLTQTTWGGTGAEFSGQVATAADGSAYLVGLTDSFAVDQFGQPAARIFVVKFATNGSVTWQRIWNGTTIRGLGNPAVALGPDGSVFVSGVTQTNGGDAVLLKFGADGALLWERTWGGTESDSANAVATAADGSVYIAGRTTSFGPTFAGFFVVKFDGAGNLVWQQMVDNTAGADALAVTADGSVYAASSIIRGSDLSQFDILVVKLTAAGGQVWRRTYSAGEIVDARGGMAAAPDGSVVLAGALQAHKGGAPTISPLIVKLDSTGALVFNRTVGAADTANSVTVAADDGSIYIGGTTTAAGAGFQDAFVLHVEPTGKKALDALTWGGVGFDEGTGVSITGGTIVLGATTSTAPPYSLLAASLKLSTPKSTVVAAPGELTAVAGVVGRPGLGAATPAGVTTYAGNSETAVVRIVR